MRRPVTGSAPGARAGVTDLARFTNHGGDHRERRRYDSAYGQAQSQHGRPYPRAGFAESAERRSMGAGANAVTIERASIMRPVFRGGAALAARGQRAPGAYRMIRRRAAAAGITVNRQSHLPRNRDHRLPRKWWSA